MSLQTTPLNLQLAPLPPDFHGGYQELAEAIVARLKIVSPFGFTSFTVGGAKPTSNKGPWFKDGTKLYTFDEDEADYAPLDISDSVSPIPIQEDEPETSDPPFWIKIEDGLFSALYAFVAGVWVPLTTTSGPTDERPANPYEFQQFWDRSIDCLLHYTSGQWVTVSGVKGDVKYVDFSTLEEALTKNPGWEYVGQNNSDIRGRIISIATKDAGVSPTADYSVASGISERAAGDRFGEESLEISEDQMPEHKHTIFTVGTSGDSAVAAGGGWSQVLREDQAATYAAQKVEDTYAIQNTGGSEPISVLQPTVAMWCLKKVV